MQAAIAYSLQSVFDIGKKFKHSSQVLSTLIMTLLQSGRLQPVLYRVIDVYDQRVARLFLKFCKANSQEVSHNPLVLQTALWLDDAGAGGYCHTNSGSSTKL